MIWFDLLTTPCHVATRASLRNLSTCQRYTSMGRKLCDQKGVMEALDVMSHRFGRDGPLDGITNLRALFSLGLSSEDMIFIIKTLIMEFFGIISKSYHHDAFCPLYISLSWQALWSWPVLTRYPHDVFCSFSMSLGWQTLWSWPVLTNPKDHLSLFIRYISWYRLYLIIGYILVYHLNKIYPIIEKIR